MSKRYGLIVPGKNGEGVIQPKADFTRPSIFGSESDSDENAPPARTAPQTSRLSMEPGNAEKRQARKLQEKALKEDPTVFQYDELYDDMETKRDEEKKAKSTEIKKPRYINRLLECAERRKIEYERRIERMAQKERETEGDEFKDKESFVTSAYRKKLEELKRAEEREKREDYLEAIGDVTKQQDLGGFYRHIYEQKLGPKLPEPKIATEKSPSSSTHKEPEKIDKIKGAKSRAYRKRQASDDNEEEITIQKNDIATKKAHLQSNLDADSDFSIDSSSDSEDEQPNKENASLEQDDNAEQVVIKQEPADRPEQEPVTEVGQGDADGIKAEGIKSEKEDKPKDVKDTKEKKVKKDIWKKRTVGEVFDAAVKRYYERKAARNG